MTKEGYKKLLELEQEIHRVYVGKERMRRFEYVYIKGLFKKIKKLESR